MIVYHFLTAQNALSNVALKRIRLSRFNDLNDPFEFLAGNLSDKEVRNAFKITKDDFDKKNGILCFSKRWSNPVLWSHYAEKHRGICLGFELADMYVIEIEYSKDRIPIEFKGGKKENGFEEGYMKKFLSTKYEHWLYEEEVRMISSLKEADYDNGNYFVPFQKSLELKEVILGPFCEIPIGAVQSLVDSIYQKVKIKKARLAFKEFKVVTDKRYEQK